MTPNAGKMDGQLNGPIPGENMTSDTRNYAWHRPPDITNLNQAVEWSMTKITSEESSPRIVSAIASGIPITTVADTFITLGISRGKWSPDFGLLLAGPVTRIMEMMAKGYEIEYELGLDDNEPIMTPAYMKSLSENDLKEKTPEELIQKVQNEISNEEPSRPSPKPKENNSPASSMSGGFMSMGSNGAASKDEQRKMLGDTE